LHNASSANELRFLKKRIAVNRRSVGRPSKHPMIQPFHPVFRHLWFLSALGMVGFAVLGFAYEKFSGDTSGLAILGFTSAIVHGAAWWFTLGVTSPLRKFVACGFLFAGAMLSAAVGRFAFLLIAEQPIQPLLTNMQFIASIIPVWWLTLAIVNRAAKELLRWRLNYHGTPITSSTSLADMFQLTAIVSVIFAFFGASLHAVVGTDYITMLLVSISLHLVVLIPLSVLILNRQRWSPSYAVLKGGVAAGLGLLFLLVFARFIGDEFERISDVGVGVSAFVVPYVLMLLMGRDKGLSLSSGWYKHPS